MKNFFQTATLIFIFPALLLAAAAFPLKCNLAKDGGVFKSRDFGSTWSQKVKIDNKQTIATKDILSLAIDPADPNILYLGTQGGGVFKSKDEAETWQALIDKNSILNKSADIYDIKIDAQNSNLAYLAVFQDNFGRILRSQDRGTSWQEIYVVDKEKFPVNAIEIDSVNDAILFAGTAQGGILKSIDNGTSWQSLKWFDSSVSDIKIDRKNSSLIYAATEDKEMWKSSDQGQTWQVLGEIKQSDLSDQFGNFGIKPKIKIILIDSSDSKILYAVADSDIFKSPDAGQTWQRLNILMPPESTTILSFVQDQQNPNNLYYGAGSVVYKTNNGGQTWTTQQVGSSRKVKVIKIDPFDSNIIYVGVSQ